MARKIIIISIVSIILSSYSLGWFAHNGSDNAYSGSGDGENTTTYTPIKQLIIEGSGFFLKSQSDLLLFLNQVELSELNGVDYVKLQKVLNGAIENLLKAQNTYLELKKCAEITEYNQDIIKRLVEFDYSSFQKDRGLNIIIFDDVKGFLSTGDVRGIYNRFYEDVVQLSRQLKKVKLDVDESRLPSISELWRINEKFSIMLLFGQYVSEVFNFLK